MLLHEDPWAAYTNYDPDADMYDVRSATASRAGAAAGWPLLRRQIAALECRIRSGGENAILCHYQCVLKDLQHGLVEEGSRFKRKASDASEASTASTEYPSDSSEVSPVDKDDVYGEALSDRFKKSKRVPFPQFLH
mmetsp:Transcript_44591/g.103092  ORF Transcript_44591/g.103092 Transcript_44591/m.103092 type:complete len:136 (-) Transcript_44591:116-523(-)